MSDVIARYLAFLLEQLQQDMRVIGIGWVHWLVLPMVVYLLFFMVKWWMLLVPVTLPLTLWIAGRKTGSVQAFKLN